MLSFTVEAAQGELGLIIKRGRSVLLMPRHDVPQVEIVLRAEADWLREVYYTLTVVFHKNTLADSPLEIGPRHSRGALSAEIGAAFEHRMRNRLNMLDQLRNEIGTNMDHGTQTLRLH